ncbi:hypothetical protein [Corynebacterium sp. ES2715-CONJ3]|uniref:hypothetical protein n=1 Tax=Corynebacterium sp. ES2715-CONJ3 TaxID=2974028 RepID=UPI002168BBE4|nr:hypothetical protein [Corynebacterium sp. ES2715-CONJ3]MCS4492398.1 hypothetical protein [Corynebacterium sp. ES2715-CONJ3]
MSELLAALMHRLSPWALTLTALALGVASVVGPWIARFIQSIFGMSGQHAHHDNQPEFLKEWDRGIGHVGEDLNRAFAPLRAEMDRIITLLRLEAEKAAPVAGPLALLGIVGVIAAWYGHYFRTIQDCASQRAPLERIWFQKNYYQARLGLPLRARPRSRS